MDVVRSALWKGCLGGLAMALLYFVISGLTYLALQSVHLSYNLLLFFSIASGPLIGTGGLLAILYLRALRSLRSTTTTSDDETTQRDAS